MLRFRLVAFTALMVVPALASAQRRGGGGGFGGKSDANWDSVATKRGPGGPSISAKDFDDTPFKFLLDKKKDVKLTEAQMTSLKSADLALKESNKTRFAAIDSLKKEAKPKTSGTPAAEDEARMVIAREALQSTVRDVMASYDEAAKTALPMLDEPQRPDAQKVLDKYNEEMRSMMREKLGAGGGAMGGGRGGRGRGGN